MSGTSQSKKVDLKGKARKAESSAPAPTSAAKLFKCGPVFIVPYGPDISLSLTKVLQNKIKDAGGQVAASAREAAIVVIDPYLSELVVQRDFLGDKMDTTAKVQLKWLTQILNGGEWIDPQGEYIWESLVPNRSTTNSAASNLTDGKSSSQEAHSSDLKIETGIDNEGATQIDSPRQREYEANVQDSANHAAAADSSGAKKKLNENLISEMSRMAEMYAAQGEKWRAKAYAQAAAILKTLDFEVTNSSQIRHRKGIGERMAAHIDEIIATGKYAKREAFEQDPKSVALVNLTKIFGVGKAIALRLYQFGYTDIESIRKGVADGDPRLQFFNKNQRIGLQYYEDLDIRIKRKEIEAIRDIIRKAAKTVYSLSVSTDLIIDAVGSFRRGKETCGDCDILLSLPSHPVQRVSLTPLVDRLVRDGFIKETLSLPYVDVSPEGDPFAPRRSQELVGRDSLVSSRSERELESETFMGICLIPSGHPEFTGIHHRMDIKSYPYYSFPYAQLYFTGSALFSRNMRQYANQKGFKLTDRGLYPLVGDVSRSIAHAIRCRTEEDIFHALGLEYREPKDRNYDEVVEESKSVDELLNQFNNGKGKGKSLEDQAEDDGEIRVKREDEDAQRFEEWLRSTSTRTIGQHPSSSSLSAVRLPSVKVKSEPIREVPGVETANMRQNTSEPTKTTDLPELPSKPKTTKLGQNLLSNMTPQQQGSNDAQTSKRGREESVLNAQAQSSSAAAVESASARYEANRTGHSSAERTPDDRESQWMRLMHGPAKRPKKSASEPTSSSSAPMRRRF